MTSRLATLGDKGIDVPLPSSQWKGTRGRKKMSNKKDKEKETIKNLNSWFKF